MAVPVDEAECRELAAAYLKMRQAEDLRNASRDARSDTRHFEAQYAEANAGFRAKMDAFAAKFTELPHRGKEW